MFVCLALGVAAWEYAHLFRSSIDRPFPWLIIGGVVVLVLARITLQFNGSNLLLSGMILFAMAVYLVAYERGCDRAATAFSLTVTGIAYLGWIGSYLISLRQLPQGLWWVLTVLPVTWIMDTSAMLVGRRFGRHLMVPRLSPRKTWEGYLGGITGAVIGGALLGWLWSLASPELSYARGALLGLVLGILTPLGDLGESMIKRQVGAKDSSNILPGHGGIFDRMDTWLWAGVIGYYMVLAFG